MLSLPLKTKETESISSSRWGRDDTSQTEPVTPNPSSSQSPKHLFSSISFQAQLENSGCTILSKEVNKKIHELRQLRGEELQGLDAEELKNLEKSLEGGLSRVLKTKGEIMEKEITARERKEARLVEENVWLKQKVPMEIVKIGQTHDDQQGQSAEFITNNGSSAAPPQDNGSSDTSLKLGCKPFEYVISSHIDMGAYY
ncbi:hypothetical protein TEA_001296 [Camellia sinensis var. sinensis]|uniref:K-box domain-containing protein n=1 Tax=Camellia sinensis var. sinensis TaxID=542762 RepID=A0A4S4DJR8_CAMSN|nr:hypothetical protein TEA_001296 [Camellia sinensis var. sinensis]